jgi:hypothetical protein
MTIKYFLRYADFPEFQKEVPYEILLKAMGNRITTGAPVLDCPDLVNWWNNNLTGPMTNFTGQTIFLFDCGKIWFQRETII